jgi:ribosomal-protein-alanine N-acetyltransferase
MVHTVGLADMVVRAATPEETGEVEELARWSDRSHLRFQLDYLPQLVRDGRVLLALREGQPCALSYTIIDYPNCSIRGLAVRPVRGSEAAIESVLAYLVPAARQANAVSIAYIGDDRWLVPYLTANGFARADSIIALQLPAGYIRERGNRECRVRPVAEADLDALVEADWSAFDLLWRNGRETIRQFFGQMPYFLVATDGEGLLGYACGTKYGKVGHLVRLVVHRRAQRRGVGTRLVREVLDRMAETGVRCLTLNTQHDNQASQAFYRSLGFHPGQNPTTVYRYLL